VVDTLRIAMAAPARHVTGLDEILLDELPRIDERGIEREQRRVVRRRIAAARDAARAQRDAVEAERCDEGEEAFRIRPIGRADPEVALIGRKTCLVDREHQPVDAELLQQRLDGGGSL
jgi:hypothetical protein